MRKELLNFFDKSNGNRERYIVMEFHGKTWIFPESDRRMGLKLFLEDSIKKRIIKWAMLYLPVWLLAKAPFISIEDIRLKKEALQKAEETFGAGFKAAYYMGDCSVLQNRKLVIQFSKEKNFLGYGKLTTEESVFQLFKNEVECLNYIKQKGSVHVPKCLNLGKEKDIYFYFQSTERTDSSQMIMDLTPAHVRILKEWHDNAKHIEKFENTDFFKDYTYLHQIEGQLDKNVVSALEQCKELFVAQNITCAFAHGDFTPWNIFHNSDGSLFVFDFEYSSLHQIEYYDYIHFYMQTERLMKKEKMKDIGTLYSEFCGCIKSDFHLKKDYIDLITMVYMISQLSFHMKRNNGLLDKNDSGFLLWTSIIQYIWEENK